MAAVDLGSNSFHMVVARLQQGQLTIIDRLREMVQLAAGLKKGRLDDASQARGLDCLARFGQRLAGLPPQNVRVVGTNTLRRLRDGDFLAAAEAALGHQVEVISGFEEARLIYLGASHSLPNTDGPTLIVDIGGGSTELIAGQGYLPERMESLFIGCVGMSQRFFADGKLRAKRFEKARLAVRLELRPCKSAFRRQDWGQTAGSSGTIRTAARIAEALGLSDAGISMVALDTIIQRMVEARRIDCLELPGLPAERLPVFPGGVAVLAEIMATLRLERLQVAEGSLREGLLYDMIGRLSEEDPRDRTVRALADRYHVDDQQAWRVAETAAALFASVRKQLGLQDDSRQALCWAANLHEIGLDIAHVKYHQHGAYLLLNGDLPGFSRYEQQLLAALVGNHRRKVADATMARLPARMRTPALWLVVLLRLAVLLHRSRTELPLPKLKLVIKGSHRVGLLFPVGWLEENPLTVADLELEQHHLADVGISFTFMSKRERKRKSA